MSDGDSHLPSEILLTGALVFSPLAFGTTENWSRAVVSLIIGILAVSRYGAFGWQGILPAKFPPLFWAAAALSAFAVLQATNPTSPTTIALARGPFTVSRLATFDWILDWGLYTTVLLIAPNVYRAPAASERLAWVILLCGAFIAVVGISQLQSGNLMFYGIRKVSEFRMPFGPFPNKNHAGAYLAMCSLIGAGLASTALEKYFIRRESSGDELLGRLGVAMALEFLVLIGLFKANSRGAFVAFIVAGTVTIAFYALSASRIGKAASLAMFLAAVAALSGVAHYAGANFIIPTTVERSFTFRYAMIADGIKMASAFPLTGVGLGALRAAYPLWIDPVMKGYYTNHLHCDPVEMAAEAGLPLTCLFFFAFLSTLAISSRAALENKKLPPALSLSFLAAALAILVHQTLEFPSHIMSIQLTALVCITAAWGRGVLTETPLPETLPPRRWRTRLVGATAAAIGFFTLTPRMAAAYFDYLASRYPQPSKNYFQVRAARWEPTMERALELALSNWQMALDNPAARQILLRTALRHSSVALDLEPAHPEARRVHAGLLRSLGRESDAMGMQ